MKYIILIKYVFWLLFSYTVLVNSGFNALDFGASLDEREVTTTALVNIFDKVTVLQSSVEVTTSFNAISQQF